MARLTHFNTAGDAHMVDVGDKPETRRIAIAEGAIQMRPETLSLIMEGRHEKGDVLAVARVAGILAAKRTADLIPLCHPLALNRVEIDLTAEPEKHLVSCRATAETVARTGVEMEALTAVSVAALTLWDMVKAVDKDLRIEGIRLVEKKKEERL